MSGFINKTYTNTIDSLTKGMLEKVKSANYVFNNKPPVIGNWYNQDKDTTTLDEGTGAEYVSIGQNSPIRFNFIEDAVFYAQGIQIEIDLEYDEDGLTTAPPSISGIVLPNTWIPYSGDYFTLKQIGSDYLYERLPRLFFGDPLRRQPERRSLRQLRHGWRMGDDSSIADLSARHGMASDSPGG